MNYNELIANGKKMLAYAGVADADLDARYLAEYVFNTDWAHLLMAGREEISDENSVRKYQDFLNRRAAGEPLQYITGRAYFMGLEFDVDESVLIPRQDTETLCEEAISILKKMDGPKVLDMCTGSGCIIISLAHICSLGEAQGADISQRALDTASRNAERLVPGRVKLIRSDMFENISGRYDMIVSNPPYIRSDVIPGLMREVRDHEPRAALDGGGDGLTFYRILASQSRGYLNDGGYLIMEIGYDQGSEVRNILEECHWKDIRIIRDLAGNERVAEARV